MIKKISIKSIRDIESVNVDFTGNLVIVGGNGSGKTTLLQAIAAVLTVLPTVPVDFSATSGIKGEICLDFSDWAEFSIACDIDGSELRLKISEGEAKVMVNAIRVGYGAGRRIKYRQSHGEVITPMGSIFGDDMGVLFRDVATVPTYITVIRSVLTEMGFDGQYIQQCQDILNIESDIDGALERLPASVNSVLAIIMDMCYRMRLIGLPVQGDMFSGIVLIDDIDMHLHPVQQRNILPALSKCFPKCQFIVTTNSPFVVQSVEGAVLVLEKNKESGLSVGNDCFGFFTGWEIGEIVTDLMSMDEAITEKRVVLSQEFQDAIAREDKAAAQKAFGELDKILHHSSQKRSLMQIQLAGVGEWE